MSEPKTTCIKCGVSILQRTADDNQGLCGTCHRKAIHQQLSARQPIYEPIPPDLPERLDLQLEIPQWESADAIDWPEVEEALFTIASHYLQAFAKYHADEKFYGLAFDCNADYCQVFICLNTEDALEEEDLRWSLGDWKYQACTTEKFSEAWSCVEESLSNAEGNMDESNENSYIEFLESFMTVACRAMVRLGSCTAISLLNRTTDFKTFVADHDESEEDAWGRFDSIRSEMNNG